MTEMKTKEKKDFLGFFIAPLFVLITIEIMHFSHMESYSQFFGNIFFVMKWLISYVFLLLFQGVLLSVIPSLATAHLVQILIFYCLGMVTEVLIRITGDPLLPSDFYLINSIGEISSFARIPVLWQCIVSFLFLIFSVVFIFKRSKTHKTFLNFRHRICHTVVAIIAFSSVLYGISFSEIIKYHYFEKMSISITAFGPKEDYFSNGLVLTFFPRIGELKFDKPKDYSEEKIDKIKSLTKIRESENSVKPHIIAVQNEALWDVTRLPGSTFSVDPLENIRRIGSEKNGKLGTFVSPYFGGNTCMPEFEFLTGMSVRLLPPNVYPYIQAINKPVSTFVSSYKENGYETYALHPYKKSFYGRNKAYPLMGFDSFIGEEDLENPEYKGEYVSDMEVTRNLIKAFEERKRDRIFEFAITMQNHATYGDGRYEEYSISVENEMFDDDCKVTVSDYTQGVYDADLAFSALVDYFREVEEPVIVVMYGDHLPLLGLNGSPYTDTGYIEKKDELIFSDYQQLFETPYIIWANYDVDLSGISSFSGPANLGVSLYKLAGLENTPWYYSFIDDFYSRYPVFGPDIVLDNHYEDVNPYEKNISLIAARYQYLQYDLLRGKNYANRQ